jgi:isopenicillin N synthase-like dioxygenase
LEDDLAFSYRMIDYFVEEDSKNQEQHPMRSRGATSPTAANAGRTVTAASPRLAEHRDFGFLTLIQQSQPGIQVKLEEDEDGRGGGAIGRRPRHRRKMHAQSKWYNLPATPNGTAILMGGWCARLRSNGRFPALLHRVPATASSGRSPSQMQQQQQRTSAVLFCNPKHTTTRLDPAVRRPTEDQRYINGVTAATLQQKLVGAKTERAVNLWLRCDDVKSKSKQERTWMSWFLPSSSSTKAQNKYNIE